MLGQAQPMSLSLETLVVFLRGLTVMASDPIPWQLGISSRSSGPSVRGPSIDVASDPLVAAPGAGIVASYELHPLENDYVCNR